jgi:competence protein ComEC
MDQIQRRLATIDRELAGRTNLHKRIIETSPLLFAATGLMIGILVQSPLALPAALWLAILAFCAIGTFVFSIIRKEAASAYVTAYLAFACFLCLGAIRLIGFQQFKPDDIRNFVGSQRRLATICGFIITPPYINKNEQWQFAQFTYADPVSSFYVRVREVKTVDGWAEVSGTVRVQVNEPVLDLKAGDYIQAYCWLDRFKEVTNPGQFDIAKYLARRNIFVAASVETRDSIELLRKPGSAIFTKVNTKLRQIAMQALLGDLSPENPSEGLLQALLLGYRANIDVSTYEAFRKTGLVHIISLSGMHFAILIGSIWWFCRVVGLLKAARAAVCLAAVAVFLLVVPPAAPAVRAAIMSTAFCASFLFRRRPNAYNTLSLAAIVLLLIRPTQLFEVDWQLSFIAVLGILLFSGRIENLLHSAVSRFVIKVGKSRQINLAAKYLAPQLVARLSIIARTVKYFGGQLIRAFCVGIAAWLGSAGMLLFHFGTITPLASVWTVLVSPLVSAILTVGLLKILLSFLLPSLSDILGVIVTNLADLLIRTAKLFADIDVSDVLIGHVSVAPVILYYFLLLFAPFVYFRPAFLKRAMSTVMISLLVCTLGIGQLQRKNRDSLVLTCLDVGHGQAILARLPGRANVLFDAGSMYKSDIGRRIVTPFLDFAGASKIDAIMISHNDVDHINGIPEIVEHCKVKSVYASKAFFIDAKTDPCGTAEFLSRFLYDKGLEIQDIKDLNLGAIAGIKMLWPTEQVCLDESLGDNDKSAVSLIEFAGRRILLCSDIERFAQKELLRLNPNLKADVVVAPHHGLVKTLDPDFLEKLGADILICSCDRNQYERMLQSAASQPASRRKKTPKTFYTPAHGAITITIDRDGTVRVTTFVDAADTRNQQK